MLVKHEHKKKILCKLLAFPDWDQFRFSYFNSFAVQPMSRLMKSNYRLHFKANGINANAKTN